MRVPIPKGRGRPGKLWRQARQLERYPEVTDAELIAMAYPRDAGDVRQYEKIPAAALMWSRSVASTTSPASRQVRQRKSARRKTRRRSHLYRPVCLAILSSKINPLIK